MSEPTIEEMQVAIRVVHPNFYHSRCSQCGGSWTCLLENGQRIGYGFGHDGAVRDAYAKLPAKAAPEPTYSGFAGKASCGCGFVSESLAESGWQELIAHMNTSHPDWNGTKAAPESEDEAFERWWNGGEVTELVLHLEGQDDPMECYKALSRLAYARARLDAERE